MSKEFRQEIKNALKEERPALSDSSLTTYSSLVLSMAKRMDKTSMAELSNTNIKDILEYAKGMKNTSSKTLLSAMFLLTKDEELGKIMHELNNEVNKDYRSRQISDHRKESYISFEEVKQFYENAKAKLKKTKSPENYVNFLIHGLMTGATIEPRRLEWANVKIRNYNKETDNYLEKNIVVFNKYKTIKSHGRQQITIPKEIMPYLRQWVKINDTDYLLLNKKLKPFSASTLSQRIGTLFNDDKIGVDILRSIYITHQYQGIDVEKLEQLQEVAKKMGHSQNMAMLVYNKKKTDN